MRIVAALLGIAFVQGVALAQAESAPAPPCSAPEFAAFDFWVGEWDVYPAGSDKLTAHSRIERLYGGCAVRENWMPLNGTGGGSLNNLDPETGRWHQTWIGSAPGRAEFEGGAADGKMVLTGYWSNVGGAGVDGLVRMTYSTLDPDTVRQFGEASFDHGLTWQTNFDLIYKRRSEPLPQP